jgi:N-acetylmuramoyl-L-alanine amidase
LLKKFIKVSSLKKPAVALLLMLPVHLFLQGCQSDYVTYDPSPRIIGKRPVYTPKPKPQPCPDPYRSKTSKYKKNLIGKTIIIDPGHGGKDPGCGHVGYSKVPEKYIVLSIARQIAERLRLQGAKVIMTRNTDCFVDLDLRAATAERYRADLLLSVHADSAPDSSAQGATIYISRTPSYASRRVAMSIHNTLQQCGIYSRGLRNADFRVLAAHSRPAVLVETGFVTNAHDASNLNNSWYQAKLAANIAQGITNSLSKGY